MSKKTWDTFVKEHKIGICVFGVIYGKSTPGQLAPDGRKLPSPFGMLKEALEKVLKGDWTIRKVGKVAQFVIADEADLVRVQKIFRLGLVQQNPPQKPCGRAYQFVYDPAVYQRLMVGLGYSTKNR